MGIKRRGGSVPAGSMVDYAGGTVPAGWLLCYGQAVSRETFAALFLAIGTAHGAGDGVTTFNLPDSRGRTTVGKDGMGGTKANRVTTAVSGFDGDVLGEVGGGQSHTLTVAELASHAHSNGANYSGYSYSHNGAGVTNGLSVINAGANGSGGAHRNMPPSIVANKMIKT